MDSSYLVYMASNIILCIIFIIYISFVLKKEKKDIIYSILLSLVLPVFGLIIGIGLMFTKKCSEKNIDSFESDIKNTNEKYDYLKPVDFEKEINVVPLEEALIINSNKIKRQMLINLIKKDAFSHFNGLKLASKDSDTETSHYAATALLEVKKRSEIKIQSGSIEYLKRKNDLEFLKSYAKVLKGYIGSNLADIKNLKKQRIEYIRVLSDIISFDEECKDCYVEKINNQLLEKDKHKVLKTCKEFLKRFSDNEEPYLMMLKYYFVVKDNKNLKLTLETLKKSNVKLSFEGLNIVRYWNEEGVS